MVEYIHERPDWPTFGWQTNALSALLAEVHRRQGLLLGQMQALGFDLQREAVLRTLTEDVLKTSEIEGEILDRERVRSSIARRLGIDAAGLPAADRHIEGIVQMMLDATQNYALPLTADRIFDWHSALFPTGRSGMVKIDVGRWRRDLEGPMQVVSGAIGKQRVHYQAPQAYLLDGETRKFLDWFNSAEASDPIIKAALAHLWFVTLHPLDDGNGRIARAIADMALARSERSPHRFYSMSAQIQVERKQYYDILEATQKGNLDITAWLTWFLECLSRAIEGAEKTLKAVLQKAAFWRKHAQTELNTRQRHMINKLFDGFYGSLTSSKWAKIEKCSQDTASRDINDLVARGILRTQGAGRSTNYVLADDTDSP